MPRPSPWWTPPAGCADVEGWLAAMREVEAVCGADGEAVPATAHAYAMRDRVPRTTEPPPSRGGAFRGSAEPSYPPPRAPQPRIETGRLRRSVSEPIDKST